MKQARTPLILAIVLGLGYLFFGATKLAMPGFSTEQFAGWGYPSWFAFVIGGAEVVTAVLLFVPRTRFLGALSSVVLMLGAIVTHLSQPELGLIPMAVVFLAASAVLGWFLRPGAPALGTRQDAPLDAPTES